MDKDKVDLPVAPFSISMEALMAEELAAKIIQVVLEGEERQIFVAIAQTILPLWLLQEEVVAEKLTAFRMTEQMVAILEVSVFHFVIRQDY